MRTAIAIFAAFTLSTTASAQSTDDTAWVHDTAQAPSANLTKPTTTTGGTGFGGGFGTGFGGGFPTGLGGGTGGFGGGTGGLFGGGGHAVGPARTVLEAEAVDVVAQLAQGGRGRGAGEARAHDEDGPLALVARVHQLHVEAVPVPLLLEGAVGDLRVEHHG